MIPLANSHSASPSTNIIILNFVQFLLLEIFAQISFSILDNKEIEQNVNLIDACFKKVLGSLSA